MEKQESENKDERIREILLASSNRPEVFDKLLELGISQEQAQKIIQSVFFVEIEYYNTQLRFQISRPCALAGKLYEVRGGGRK